jgi:hypothetical protein
MCATLVLIESIVHDDFLSHFNLHIWLNMSIIIIFSKQKLHPWFHSWMKVWLLYYYYYYYFIFL